MMRPGLHAAIIALLMLPAASLAAGPADLTARADSLLGVAYRPDGVRDEQGRWTLFERPDQRFDTPGLNCSGLDYALMRLLSPGVPPVGQVSRDRAGDSGPGAAMGRDWDFGFDLILNLTDRMPRHWLLPEPRPVSPSDSGRTLLGFPVADRQAWARALAQVRPGQACLVSFSQTGRRAGYTLQHYHVGVILADSGGGRWLYQATPKSGAHKIDLANETGMRRFLGSFSGGDKRVLLLLADLGPSG